MASNPSITATIKDINSDTIALTGDKNVLIRYRSTANVTMSATAYGESVINLDTAIIRNGNDTLYAVTGDFNNVESEEFTFSVEDSMGRVGRKTVTVDMIPYIELTCNIANNKPDADGDMRIECTGDYFNGSFGARSNSLTVKYRYKKSGGSFGSWKSMSVSTLGDGYTAYADLSGLDYQASYAFEVQAEDELTIVGSEESGVSSLPVFHWSGEDFTFEVPVEFNSTEETRIHGDLWLRGGGNYGNRLKFGDGSYCYIAEDTDDDMTIHAESINLETDKLLLNGNNITLDSGEWTPEVYDEAARVYEYQAGWYSRMGDVVTVGFFLKVYCYSGYEDTEIVISGLPFEVGAKASGGGVCSGAYVAGGYTFQCFVAEEGSTEITVRVQECDRTSDGNIDTSASGCYYPEDGGTITLSGTITYIA